MHPPHVGICINAQTKSDKFSGKKFKTHRDGSASCYLKDPDGNFVEFLIWEN